MSNSALPHLLYLVHRVPFPRDKGDRIRSFHLLRCLSRRATVHLACLADEPVHPAARAQLLRHCARVEIFRLDRWRWARALGSLARGRTITEGAFRCPALQRRLVDWAGDTRFEAALASASSMVPYLLHPQLRHVPAVVDLVDVDSEKWFEFAASRSGWKAWLYRLEGERLRRLEQSLPSWARAITLVSEAEAQLYRRLCPGGSVHAITQGVDLDYYRPGPTPSEPHCVFIGALDYWPNVAGISWFCRQVWTHVRKRWPACRLSLVGRRPVPLVRRLAELPGVEVVGQVADVRPYLSRAAVVLAPLNIARGVQNKVLEALAMGKATVVSPQALTGLQVEPDVHLLTASTESEWQEAVSRLLQDEGLRQRLGTAGRRYVEAHHSWEHCSQPLANLLRLGPEPNPVSGSLPPLEEVA
jgi:sugar transferase (PEP-CTERM/EpsH1 system associated)